MANYSLVINSKFQPFSFERYMQPVMQYAQLYETQQAALDTLLEKSSEWERLANMSGSKESYNKYKSYSEDLRKAADELATKGLTPNSRGELTRLRKGYFDNIRPIERAYERWQELEKEQRTFNANNNFNVRYDNDFTNGINLDDLVKNPMMSYTAIKGDDVMTRTSALAKQAMQAIIDSPEISDADKGLLITKMQSGATLEQLNRALQMGLEPGQTGDKAVDALLQVARTVNESYKGNPAYDQDFMWRNISQGLYGGVGTTTYNVIQDPSYSSPLQWAQYQLSEDQFEYEKQKDQAEFNAKYGNHNGQINPDTGNPIFYDDKGIAHEGYPEIVNGIRTGRFYNPVIKKYVNQDGTLSAQGNYAESIGDPVRFKPIFARSWSAGAHNAYKKQRTWTGSDDEISKVNYSDIHNKQFKQDIKSFLLRVLDVADLSDGQVEELSGYLDIYRDQDLLSNNHWIVKVPGTDNDGNVLTDSESKRKFNTAMANMSNRVMASPAVADTAPAGVETK